MQECQQTVITFKSDFNTKTIHSANLKELYTVYFYMFSLANQVRKPCNTRKVAYLSYLNGVSTGSEVEVTIPLILCEHSQVGIT